MASPASALPDEPPAHALESARVHGRHQDCHHRVSSRGRPVAHAGAGWHHRGSGGRETSWILVPVDEELPTRAAEPRFFGGRGGVRDGNDDIDPGDFEALRAVQPRGSRRPASMQLIHHQVLAPARAYNTPTYPRSPCSCVILQCYAQLRPRRELSFDPGSDRPGGALGSVGGSLVRSHPRDTPARGTFFRG